MKLYVGYLRRKLESVLPSDEVPIETVRGFGYRYLGPAAQAAVGAAPVAEPAAAAPRVAATNTTARRFPDGAPPAWRVRAIEPGGIL